MISIIFSNEVVLIATVTLQPRCFFSKQFGPDRLPMGIDGIFAVNQDIWSQICSA